ncbi:hypothetical protein [Paenibacillus chitinolyticus]|uniref:hypothetical protein n=1 Tax=Paenibacillus chitinolyticus TaxID=79263 RepID=UPI003D038577
MGNILYFEGAGMDYETNEFSNVGNYRIRTAFFNNEGVPYYIELGNTYRRNEKNKVVSEWALRVDHLIKIDEKNSDYEMAKNWKEIIKFDYTKEAITNWINANLNCSFKTIHVLNMFYGYRVHGDNRQFNIVDNHVVNHELARKRESAYRKVDEEYRKLLNEEYSMIGLLEMDDNSITIRCHASKEALGGLPRVKRIDIE